MHIGNCWLSILIDASINILYGGTLEMMEDTPEMARAMINQQTWSYLYRFDGNETHSPGTILLPMRANPYNVITEFYVIDMESSLKTISGGLGST